MADDLVSQKTLKRQNTNTSRFNVNYWCEKD